MLSVAVICRNNADTLRNVIEDSLGAGAQEIVICDTHPGKSNDGTGDICSQYDEVKLVYFPWIDDFAAARNYAFEQTTGDWILWIDTDDRIPTQTQEEIKLLLDESSPNYEKIKDVNGIFLLYEMMFQDKVVQSFPRERIINRKAFENGSRWEYAIHECIALAEPVARVDIGIQHLPGPEKKKDPHRNLKILKYQYESGKDTSPRIMFYLAREYYWNGMYAKAIAMFKKWVKTGPVFWEKYSGMLELSDCYAKLGRDKERKETLYKLVEEQPERAEVWYMLGLEHYNKKEFEKATPYFSAAARCHRPEAGFVTEQAYSYLVYDYLAICLGMMGMISEAYELTKQNVLPYDSSDRILNNLKFYEKRLSEKH